MWSVLLILAITGAMGEVVNRHVDNNTDVKFGFEVDYTNNQFLLDGKPFRYVSGSFHYFRTPRQYWRDRLRKMRAAGLNAVSTYVEWSLHQPEEDQWEWTGDADLKKFIEIAHEEDLLVLLRPGPYICAERDFGGLPYWLLPRVPVDGLRTNNEQYMQYVEVYLNEVLERVKPYLRGNGGPIIMVQVENEYGSYGCSMEYKTHLRDIISAKVGTKALLYTTDGTEDTMLRCGSIPNVYTTIDFGANSNVRKNFETLRTHQPRGPLVNSEFYPGWLSHWQEPFQRVKTGVVTKSLDEILSMGASVNIYMFYGGTNFAYTSGANGDRNMYNPQLTSYDYDAPLTEAGDPTTKYFEIRNVISKYLPLPNTSIPSVSPKGDYGSVLLSPVVKLLEPLGEGLFSTVAVEAPEPLTFETVGLSHYLMIYETTLPSTISDPAILSAIVRDRALVYVDNYLFGILSRTSEIHSLNINPYGRKLKLLVENQGRLNFGHGLYDYKGISNVTFGDATLGPWRMVGYQLDDMSGVSDLETITIENGFLRNGPVVLRGNFSVSGEPMDTYLNTFGWGKGVAFVNGHNLGRYWPVSGPQVTLYVPAPFLKTGENELIVLELEYVPNTRKMKLQPQPILDYKPILEQ
ncbi:beta-galactosidase [Megachile rotundata]|uniref:beta-galactosidase n=1 Tax=Megachile rotundata TaxID=143995 RepID=UPI003FD0AC7E